MSSPRPLRISGLPDPAAAANGDYVRYSATPELNGRAVYSQKDSAAKNYLWHDGHSWSLGPEIDGEQCCLYADSAVQNPADVTEGWKVWDGHDWADLYNVATRPGRIALSDTVRCHNYLWLYFFIMPA